MGKENAILTASLVGFYATNTKSWHLRLTRAKSWLPCAVLWKVPDMTREFIMVGLNRLCHRGHGPHVSTSANSGTDSPPHFVYLFIFIKYSSHLLFIILKEYVRVKTQKDKVKYHYFSSMKGIYHGTTWTDCNFIWLYHPLMIHNLPYNIITSIKILIGTTQRAQKKKEVIIDVIIRSWNASILDNSLIKRQEKNDYNDATKKHFNYNCIP